MADTTQETPQETPEEKIVREAAALKDANTAPGAKQPVAKQAEKPKKEKDEPFEGQVVQSDHFAVTTGDRYGRALVSIAPTGYVGEPPLVIPGWKLKDLIKTLQKIKSVPDEPKAAETSPTDTGSDEE